jgi:hypothetical protein
MGGFTNYTDQDFANLLARVNQLDGSGLPKPNSSTVNQLQSQINGVLTTIQQVSLNFQTQMTNLLNQVSTLQNTLNQSLGVSGTSSARKAASH